MDVPVEFLSQSLILTGWMITAAVLVFVLIKMPWSRLREGDSTNVLFGAIVFLVVMWGIKAGVSPQQNLHFLGMTALTLMFGWHYALIAALVLVSVATARYELGWAGIGFNFVTMGCIPVLVAHSLLTLSQRYLPHNFFIYIFLNTFFSAGLGFFLGGMTSYWLIDAADLLRDFPMVNEYPLFLLLLAFPEGGLNGMTVTAIVVYRPEWVATFHDRMYLRGK